MSIEKEDPIKLHKQGNILYETGKYPEAAENFLRSSELYEKKSNFFDASNMLYKAGECSFMLEDYKVALERFTKSAELAFKKGFDRFGVSGLEYVLDCYKKLKKEKSKEAIAIQKEIKKIKEKLASQFL
ncbi:MAG: tetratricopeptide repeat protein [Candidatus Bathyarchaeota archaeon]|nr:MAG: tetratricopeptide repeat protein [Candidatus Bathyarchaeota archaeon]